MIVYMFTLGLDTVPGLWPSSLCALRVIMRPLMRLSVRSALLRRRIGGWRAAATVGRAYSTASHREFDVVIAGGGAMGASVAYHLAHEDPSLKIAIVERDVAGAHASAPRSAGGIRQQFSLRTNIELSLYGIDFLRRVPLDLRVPGSDPPDVQFKEQGCF